MDRGTAEDETRPIDPARFVQPLTICSPLSVQAVAGAGPMAQPCTATQELLS
jgi:hypothetical protein